MDRLFIVKISTFLRVRFFLSSEVSDFIACQFALESNFGKSDLAVKYHNFIGMKVPFVRLSTCVNFSDSSTTFAHYGSLSDCVCDYILWLQYQHPLRKQLENLSLFKGLLKSYCPERDYISKIESIYNQFINSNS